MSVESKVKNNFNPSKEKLESKKEEFASEIKSNLRKLEEQTRRKLADLGL